MNHVIKKMLVSLLALLTLTLTSCTENFSNGEKVGYLIEFTYKGVIWKSWEGSLTLSQTGMNSSGEPFYFSFDNDRDDQQALIELMKKAQVEGWKLKLHYHKVYGKNVFSNRGDTDYFIDGVTVLDKHAPNPAQMQQGGANNGVIHDTVWVVIDKSEVMKELQQRKK